MKKFFLYLALIFVSLFYSTFIFSQEVGLKEIIKKQQDKIQLIEDNLKSLIGQLENKKIDKSILDQIDQIENGLSKISNQ